MEQQHIADQTACQANYDAKKYICGPWLHARTGGPWELVFKPAFLDALRGKKDNFSSLFAHFVTETGVGAAHGPAHTGFKAACPVGTMGFICPMGL